MRTSDNALQAGSLSITTRSALVALLLIVPSRTEGLQRGPLSMEFSVGVGVGYTDSEYVGSNVGFSADALAGVRMSGRWTIAAGVSANTEGPGEDLCRLTPAGDCAEFGHFTSVSLLGGWENRSARLRFVAGPAYVSSSSGGSALALEARADLTAWISNVAGIGLTLRSTTVPDLRDDAFQLFALGLALRIRESK